MSTIKATYKNLNQQFEDVALDYEKKEDHAGIIAKRYATNAANLVHVSVTNRTPLELVLPEPQSKHYSRSHYQDYKSYLSQLEIFMKDTPKPGILNWLTGSYDRDKKKYLEKLQTHGEELIEKAKLKNQLLQKEIDEAKGNGKILLKGVHDYYGRLHQAFKAKDLESSLGILCQQTPEIPAGIKRELLLKPINGQKTALLAVTALAGNSAEEADVLRKFLVSSHDKKEALDLLLSSAEAANEPQKNLYMAQLTQIVGEAKKKVTDLGYRQARPSGKSSAVISDESLTMPFSIVAAMMTFESNPAAAETVLSQSRDFHPGGGLTPV